MQSKHIQLSFAALALCAATVSQAQDMPCQHPGHPMGMHPQAGQGMMQGAPMHPRMQGPIMQHPDGKPMGMHQGSGMPPVDMRVQMMTQRFGLSEEQQQKLTTLFTEQDAAMQKHQEAQRQWQQAQREKMNQAVEDILTDEQKAKFKPRQRLQNPAE